MAEVARYLVVSQLQHWLETYHPMQPNHLSWGPQSIFQFLWQNVLCPYLCNKIWSKLSHFQRGQLLGRFHCTLLLKLTKARTKEAGGILPFSSASISFPRLGGLRILNIVWACSISQAQWYVIIPLIMPLFIWIYGCWSLIVCEFAIPTLPPKRL